MKEINLKELNAKTQKMKILYVEDNETIRNNSYTMLKNLFTHVDIAVDGQDGLNKYKEFYFKENECYSIVLSDINMPKMSGIDMSKEIISINPQQHIIIISAHNEMEHLQQCIEIGISSFMHKPLKYDELIDVLNKIINSYEKQNTFNDNINKIQQLNHELDALVGSFDSYIIASRTDLRGFITYTSKAFQNTYGYSKDELLGKSHNIIRHPDMASDVYKNLWDTVQKEDLWSGEFLNLTRDGSEYWVNATIAPYYDENKKHIGYSAIRVDITSQKKIESLNEHLNDLLNSAGQGFLSFTNDLKCETGFSKECLKILKHDNLVTLDISEILFKNNDSDKNLFQKGIKNIIKSEEELTKELLLSLLPKEQIIYGKNIKIEYRILNKNRFMIILTDVTKTEELKKKIDTQNQIHKMVIATVSNKNDFLELKYEFENFITSPPVDTISLLRDLHTFKGLFFQKEMPNITSHIHELESKLTQLNSTQEIMKAFFESNLQTTFNEYIELIKSTLGESFFDNGYTLSIAKSSLEDIEKKIDITIDKYSNINELHDIKDDIDRLKYIPIREMLAPFIVHVKQMGEKLDKYLYPLDIKGDSSVLVSPHTRSFIKSLVHLFTNCIDHGIEDIELRVEREKDEFGTILCSYEEISNIILIEIGDDGNGIDIDKLAGSAVLNKVITDKELAVMDDKEKLNLVFYDAISTKESVSILSGRGIGMSAIKAELDKLKGTAIIENTPDCGVIFKFMIPLTVSNKNSSICFKCKSIYDSISSQIKMFLKESLKIELIEFNKSNEFILTNNYSKIDFYNSFKGSCIIILDDNIKKVLDENLIPDGFSDEEINEISTDLPNEMLNTIIGLALKDFSSDFGNIEISYPLKINSIELSNIINKSKYKSINVINTIYGKATFIIIREENKC